MNKEYVLEKLAQTSTSLTLRGMTGKEKFNEFFRNGWAKFKNAKTPSKFALVGAVGGLAGLGLSKLFGGSKKNDMSKEAQTSFLTGYNSNDPRSTNKTISYGNPTPTVKKNNVIDTNKVQKLQTWQNYNIDTTKTAVPTVTAPKDTNKTVTTPPAAPKGNGGAVGAKGGTFADGLKTLKSGSTTADSVKTLGNLPFTVDDSNAQYAAAGTNQAYSLRQNQHTKNVYSDIAGVNMEAINMNLRDPAGADKMKEGYEGLQGYYDKLKANPKDRNNYQNFVFAKAKMDWAANKDKNVTFDKIMQDNHKLYSSNTDNLKAGESDVYAFDKPAAPTGLKKKAPVSAAGAAVNPIPGQFNTSYPFSSPKPVDFGTPTNKLKKPGLKWPKNFTDPNAPEMVPTQKSSLPPVGGPFSKIGR